MRWAGATWTHCVLRKATRCHVCARELRKGDAAFKPLGNQTWRARRICAPCVDGHSVPGMETR